MRMQTADAGEGLKKYTLHYYGHTSKVEIPHGNDCRVSEIVWSNDTVWYERTWMFEFPGIVLLVLMYTIVVLTYQFLIQEQEEKGGHAPRRGDGQEGFNGVKPASRPGRRRHGHAVQPLALCCQVDNIVFDPQSLSWG